MNAFIFNKMRALLSILFYNLFHLLEHHDKFLITLKISFSAILFVYLFITYLLRPSYEIATEF